MPNKMANDTTFDPQAEYAPATTKRIPIDVKPTYEAKAQPIAQFDPGSSYHPASKIASDVVDPNSLEEQIKNNPFRVMQIPFEQLGAQAGRAHDELADKMLSDAAKGKGVSKADYVKSFLLGSAKDISSTIGSTLSPEGIATGAATALAPEIMGPVLLAHGGFNAARNAPDALKGNPDAAQAALGSLAEATGGAALTAGTVQGSTPAQEFFQKGRYLVRRLSGALMTPQEAAQVPTGTLHTPVTAVSNADVIAEAKAEGIDLTPGQASRDRIAQTAQSIGEDTLTPGGKELQDAMELNRGRLEQAYDNFIRRNDIHALGTTAESAGEASKTYAQGLLETAKDNAEIAYKQTGIDQANIAVDVKTPLQRFIDKERLVRQPQAAKAQSEYKSPAVEAALNDIERKIDDPRLSKNASVQSARNLRTEFWEKANDYSGTIPDAAKRIYRLASQIPDDAMMHAAQGTPFEQSFREASRQWREIKANFDEPGEPLYKILQSKDAKQAYNTIVNGKSADVIAKLRTQNFDLSPIQGQVLRDIAGKNFRATGNTLAGYSDAFLQQLFGPQGAAELYVKSEIARRLNLNINPSGTARKVNAIGQIGWNPASWMRGETAARVSMPRDPTTFVSPTGASAAPRMNSLAKRPLALRTLLGSQGAELLRNDEQ